MPGTPVTLTPLLPRFFAWWMRELSSLVPSMRTRRSRGLGAWIVVSSGCDGIEIIEAAGDKHSSLSMPSQTADLSAIAGQIAALKQEGRFQRHRIGIRLPYNLCYARTLEIPKAATHDALRIMDMDLERNLPFQKRDVAVAQHRLRGTGTGGNAVFEQLIVKREFFNPLKEAIEAEGIEIDRVDCWDSSGAQALPLNFIETRGEKVERKGARPVTAGLVALSLILAASAVGVHAYRYHTAIEDVRTASAAAREIALAAKSEATRLGEVRLTYERLVELRASEVRRLDALRVLSEILPDSDFLTELRIEDDQLSMSGYSQAAAALVPLLEKSRKLFGARLVAPITFDSRVGKERFSIAVRLNPSMGGRITGSTQIEGNPITGKNNL